MSIYNCAKISEPKFPICLTVQSSVVRGYVGNKAATISLQLHGIEADPLNTCQLSNHADYPVFAGSKTTEIDLENIMYGLRSNSFLQNYRALLFGYLGSEKFAMNVPKLVEEILSAIHDSKDTDNEYLFVCDPVFGEGGNVYMPLSFIDIYKKQLIPHATHITPNQTEAEELSGIKIKTLSDAKLVAKKLHDLGVNNVIITSFELPQDYNINDDELSSKIYPQDKNNSNIYHDLHISPQIMEEEAQYPEHIHVINPPQTNSILYSLISIRHEKPGNDIVNASQDEVKSQQNQVDSDGDIMYITRVPKYASYISGTGDFLAASITGKLCYKMPLQQAWEESLAAIHVILRRTLLLGRQELAIIQMRRYVTDPQASVVSYAI